MSLSREMYNEQIFFSSTCILLSIADCRYTILLFLTLLAQFSLKHLNYSIGRSVHAHTHGPTYYVDPSCLIVCSFIDIIFVIAVIFMIFNRPLNKSSERIP